MTDLIWSLATSYLTLSIIGIILLASLVVGYFPLAKYLPVIGPYVEAAKLIAFLLFGLLMFLVATRLTDERAEVKRLKTDLAFTQLQLDTQKQTAEQAQKLRDEAEKQAAEANQKVTDYEDRLAKSPSGCGCSFDDDDVNSLRGIAR
jgi:hypothetical protein